MKCVGILLALAVGVAFGSEGRQSYEGYQVISALPLTKSHVTLLKDWMAADYPGLDFWQEPSRVRREVTVMVMPHKVEKVKSLLEEHNIPYSVENENVQTQLDEMWAELDAQDANRMAFDYDNFNSFEDIMAELERLAAQCPSEGLQCDLYSIGESYEGRDIKVLKVSTGGNNKRGYWVDGTIHAREWLATTTAVKIAGHLVQSYGSDSNVRSMVDKYDWYVLPVMNPDGYAYSRSNNRYWRKNRRPVGSGCYGADLNRNFDWRWGREGVSNYPCSDLFCGTSGGSEPETQAVQEEAKRLGPSLLAWVTIHAYGQMWMFPWGNTENFGGWFCDRADDHADMMVVADATANAIQSTYSTRWSRGNSCEVIYETTGGTDDYAKGVAGVKYSFCPELRGRDFVVNRSEIDPSFREVFNGLIAMTNSIASVERL